MPVSQGSTASIPGMQLKAWAIVRADGTLIKSMNVAGVSAAASNFTINFSAAMAGTDYLVKATRTATAGESAYSSTCGFLLNVKTTAQMIVSIRTFDGSTWSAAAAPFLVEVWE